MKKRVLFTASRFFPSSYGGGEMYVLSLAQELAGRGYDVLVVTLAPWQEHSSGNFARNDFIYEGTAVAAVSFNPAFTTEGEKYAVNHPLLRLVLKDVITEFSPHIIHINGINSATLMVAKDLRLPTITTIHHSGIACTAGALVRPDHSLCQYAADPSVCVPCCSFYRSPHWWSGGILGKTPSWFYRRYGKRVDSIRRLPYLFRVLRYPWLVDQSIDQMHIVWKFSERFIAPSLAIKRLLLRNGVEEGRILVIPHGIRRLQREELKFDGKRKIKFGFVGQFSFIKGIHLIVQALERLHHGERCELHLFGTAQTSEEELYFYALIENYAGAARIIQHGYQKGEELQKAYSSIDVLLCPSLAYEAYGLVVAESLAVGRPVIVSSSGALPELVNDGESGYVVERNSRDELLLAMQRCIDSPELIRKMAQRIPPMKTVHQYGDEIEKVYGTSFARVDNR